MVDVGALQKGARFDCVIVTSTRFPNNQSERWVAPTEGSHKGGTGTAPPEASPFTAPQISLPKGGGAIRGIDEKFAANPVTGTGSLSIPLALSPGRSGFGAKLSIDYDS